MLQIKFLMNFFTQKYSTYSPVILYTSRQMSRQLIQDFPDIWLLWFHDKKKSKMWCTQKYYYISNFEVFFQTELIHLGALSIYIYPEKYPDSPYKNFQTAEIYISNRKINPKLKPKTKFKTYALIEIWTSNDTQILSHLNTSTDGQETITMHLQLESKL